METVAFSVISLIIGIITAFSSIKANLRAKALEEGQLLQKVNNIISRMDQQDKYIEKLETRINLNQNELYKIENKVTAVEQVIKIKG